MQRLLAIDYGTRRVGLAISDPLGIAVRPLPALVREDGGSLAALARDVADVARDQEAHRVVIGIPLQMDGKAGIAAREVRAFAEALRKTLAVAVEEIDERLSTRQAHAVLKEYGVKASQRKQRVDSTAAVLLLQSYLARRRNRPPT